MSALRTGLQRCRGPAASGGLPTTAYMGRLPMGHRLHHVLHGDPLALSSRRIPARLVGTPAILTSLRIRRQSRMHSSGDDATCPANGTLDRLSIWRTCVGILRTSRSVTSSVDETHGLENTTSSHGLSMRCCVLRMLVIHTDNVIGMVLVCALRYRMHITNVPRAASPSTAGCLRCALDALLRVYALDLCALRATHLATDADSSGVTQPLPSGPCAALCCGLAADILATHRAYFKHNSLLVLCACPLCHDSSRNINAAADTLAAD
jgi:hypothetical protein